MSVVAWEHTDMWKQVLPVVAYGLGLENDDREFPHPAISDGKTISS